MTRRRKGRAIGPGDLPVRFTAFFDGCCEPKNPGGTAGYGCVIFDRTVKPLHSDQRGGTYGSRVFEYSGMIPAAPTTSNNVAEYLAMLHIMEWAKKNAMENESFHIFGDSRLVICQLWGWPPGTKKWKINGIDTPMQAKGFYADTAVRARETLKLFPRMQGFWIPREKNSFADELSKAEVKRAGVKFKIQPERDTA